MRLRCDAESLEVYSSWCNSVEKESVLCFDEFRSVEIEEGRRKEEK